MSQENTFNTEEDLKIGGILEKAYAIKDKEKRHLFIEKECNGNLIMFEYLIESLDEMDFGESGFTDSTLESGYEVGNYRIIEKINAGGIATVYSAEHKVLKTLAAIKVFDKLDFKNVENDLFWNTDHRSLSRFNHDNIVKLYDVGEYEKDDNKLPYIAVEFVKGKHLDNHCESKALSIREVLELFQDLCEVIEFIHDKEKILHLDLKPDNILVTADSPHRIKLIDFGSSKLFRSETKQFTRSDLVNPLTLKFAPPEQYDQNEVLSAQADVYSLGVILYLLITKKVPFGAGEKDKEKIREEVTDKNHSAILPSKRVLELDDEPRFGVSIKKLSEVLSGDLDSIIMKALEKRRGKRYQSVSEFRQDIDNFLQGKLVKAKGKNFNYKIFKPFLRLLGFKGGLTGADKWRTPLRRLAVFTFLLTSLSLAGIFYYKKIVKAPKYPPIEKRLGEDQEEKIQTYLKVGATQESIITQRSIKCGPEGKEEECFSFVFIRSDSFTMGLFKDQSFTNAGERAKQKIMDSLIKDDVFKKVDDKTDSTITDEDENSKPTRRVKIEKDIYMGKFEITNKQWNIVAKAEKINLDLEVTEDNNSLPKTNISYSKAEEFCKRLTADLNRYTKNYTVQIRLPTEAEWEFACHAEEASNRSSFSFKYDYKFSNSIIIPQGENEQLFEQLFAKLNAPKLESYLNPNLNGLVAMNGNVWEIVLDEWHENYDGAPDDGKSWGNPSTTKKNYVLRGGAYNERDYKTQCAYRKEENFLSAGNDQTGFRVVMELESFATAEALNF